MTLNLGGHFATLLGLPLTMLIVGGGQSILNLGGHFATLLGLSLTMLILGGQLTLNLGSHFATLLGLLLTMLIGGSGGLDTQLGKSLCNFAGITSDNVDAGGSINTTWEVTLQLCWDYL